MSLMNDVDKIDDQITENYEKICTENKMTSEQRFAPSTIQSMYH